MDQSRVPWRKRNPVHERQWRVEVPLFAIVFHSSDSDDANSRVYPLLQPLIDVCRLSTIIDRSRRWIMSVSRTYLHVFRCSIVIFSGRGIRGTQQRLLMRITSGIVEILIDRSFFQSTYKHITVYFIPQAKVRVVTYERREFVRVTQRRGSKRSSIRHRDLWWDCRPVY